MTNKSTDVQLVEAIIATDPEWEKVDRIGAMEHICYFEGWAVRAVMSMRGRGRIIRVANINDVLIEDDKAVALLFKNLDEYNKELDKKNLTQEDKKRRKDEQFKIDLLENIKQNNTIK